MYRFNVPPSWPLPSDFVPPEGWAPHQSFEPAPSSWEFWVLEDYDPEVPVADFEDRGMFNKHPLEVAARKAELDFIEAKNFVNSVIDKASWERNRKEQTRGFSRFFKIQEEKYVEECIPPLVHFGIKASQARKKAEEEYERWKYRQEIELQIASKPDLSDISQPQYQQPSENALKSSPPVPKISPAPKYKIQPVITPDIVDSVESPEVPAIFQQATTSVTVKESLKPSSDAFWDSFIQKINKLNLFRLSKGKKELVQALDGVKQSVEVYENILRGHRWTEVQESLRLTEEEIATKRQKTDDEITRSLNENSLHITSLLWEAKKELEDIKRESQRLAQINAQESERVDLNNVSYYDYYHPAATSVQLSAELKEVQRRTKEMCKNKTATFASDNFTFNNSATQGRKFVNDLCTLMLIAYNQEAENAITKATGAGRDLHRALDRLNKANTKIKRMGNMIEMEINPEYHQLRLREIKLAFKYKEQQELEKEQQREYRAQLREEEKVRKELENKQRALAQQELEIQKKLEAQRIAKLQYEKTHLENALSEAEQIKRLNDSEKANAMIAELQTQLIEIRKSMERNSQTIANTKAGWVYVISNVGALGEGIVKIGLTRRHDPLDRVRELSSASVPFIYDVHALHFSSDAVQLETALHQHFSSKKVNLVNQRKEFFYVTPEEVRDAMQKFSNGALTKFNVEAPAAQWRQSERVRNERICNQSNI